MSKANCRIGTILSAGVACVEIVWRNEEGLVIYMFPQSTMIGPIKIRAKLLYLPI